MAIIGKPIKEKKLTKEAILDKISTYDVYRQFFGPFKINQICRNHLRGEKDDSFIIGDKVNKNLTHKDFGDSYWKGDAFGLVQQIYKCDFPTALILIDKEFKLGLNDGQVGDVAITWEKPIIEAVPPPSFIIDTRPFTQEELRYWSEYYQDIEDLKRENIYAPKTIYRNRRKVPTSQLLTFCYYYPTVDKWKIYRPHGKKGKKVWYHERKWDTNLNFEHIENIDSLSDERVYGEKSKKDRMFMRKVLETDNIFNVQAEDIGCYSKESIDFLNNKGPKLIFGDGDKKGYQYTSLIKKTFNWEVDNAPHDELKGISDYADLGKETNIETVQKVLKQNGIL